LNFAFDDPISLGMELITLSIAGSTLVFVGQSFSLLHDQFFARSDALERAQKAAESKAERN
jgi:hypothetical protein